MNLPEGPLSADSDVSLESLWNRRLLNALEKLLGKSLHIARLADQPTIAAEIETIRAKISEKCDSQESRRMIAERDERFRKWAFATIGIKGITLHVQGQLILKSLEWAKEICHEEIKEVTTEQIDTDVIAYRMMKFLVSTFDPAIDGGKFLDYAEPRLRKAVHVCISANHIVIPDVFNKMTARSFIDTLMAS